MLTRRDREVFETTGNLTPDRIRAAQHALAQRALAAHDASRATDHPSAKAALRGKRKAYIEAAQMLNSLLAGNALKKRGAGDRRTR